MNCVCMFCFYEWETSNIEEPCPSCGAGAIEDEELSCYGPEDDYLRLPDEPSECPDCGVVGGHSGTCELHLRNRGDSE